MNAWKNSLFCFVFKRQTELSWLLHLSKQRPIVVRENICMMETKGKYSRGGCKGNRQGMVMGNWLLTKYKDRYLKKCQNEIHDLYNSKLENTFYKERKPLSLEVWKFLRTYLTTSQHDFRTDPPIHVSCSPDDMMQFCSTSWHLFKCLAV